MYSVKSKLVETLVTWNLDQRIVKQNKWWEGKLAEYINYDVISVGECSERSYDETESSSQGSFQGRTNKCREFSRSLTAFPDLKHKSHKTKNVDVMELSIPESFQVSTPKK